ncbi:MAG: Nif3-like dinuclear metal center hexameric protein [Saprospiraceae bacterium]|nr:Nif3-like dinuclear metal center hexameric protein [Saprospiraceae bacterium]
MKLNQLIQFFQDIAPAYLQEDYDNAGLITGHPDMEIKGVVVCLDCIEEVINEAIDLGCNVVVAHHPIVFRGLKRLNGNNYIERTIIKAIKNDIAIFAIHTNLDNVFISGVNTKIAEKLGLKDIRILAPKGNLTYKEQTVGAGMIGYLDKELETSVFMSYLKSRMNLEIIRHTAWCKEKISTVAVCGGSGGFLLNHAKNQGADIFITADYKYHEFFDADGDIVIADIGHFESEKFTIELLYDLIINNFSTFASHCTKNVTNPIKYF